MIYHKIKRSWIRWTTWEFLPMWLSNLPIAGFYLWFAVKARHLLFFSAANPAIPLGGAMGESKYDIQQRLPAAVLPKMLFVKPDMEPGQLQQDLQTAGLQFPLIAKPDVGERGFLVKKIESPEALQQHLKRYRVDFILQEYIQLPLEASVVFIRFPGETGRFRVSSVCVKEFLQIVGDGKHSIRDLILNNPRAAFQLERIEQEFPGGLEQVLPAGETMPLGLIGNHCLGTKFINANHLIDKQLENSFEKICNQIDGIYFGRFDLKCADIDALKNGQIQVMELNGVLGEPAHVYDPAVGAWRAYRDFWQHWRSIFEVSEANRKRGISVATIQEGRNMIRQYLAYKKQLV